MLGRISSVQTLGTLDGPGVRFVLFLQGCTNRCVYCHNPETWDLHAGTERSAEDVLQQVLRYRAYFGKQGGITVSGGEPCLQAAFVKELFTLCKKANIHTVLDTSGSVWNDTVSDLLSVTDLCILDYKMTNHADYQNYIGCKLSQVQQFLDILQQRNINTWLRQVIVSQINDTKESVQQLYQIAKEHPCVSRVELLRFRKFCVTKYDELNIPFPLRDTPETSEEQIIALQKAMGIR